MKYVNKIILSLIISLMLTFGPASVYANSDGADNYQIVQLKSPDGKSQSDAAFFIADTTQAVIFAPGSRYGKESWYFLAELFQKKNIASLSTGGSSVDIENAIIFLSDKGFNKIALVGASMGGESVLDVLKQDNDKRVNKAVLVAPFGGYPVKSNSIEKLFIVAKKDGRASYSSVQDLYRDSAEPKEFKVYEKSRAHGHELFASKRTKEDVVNLILDFIARD